ncbi:hypothetical protein ACFQ10_08190 [Streptomyces indonesiensis]
MIGGRRAAGEGEGDGRGAVAEVEGDRAGRRAGGGGTAATVAVKVTVWPVTEGDGEAVSTVVDTPWTT